MGRAHRRGPGADHHENSLEDRGGREGARPGGRIVFFVIAVRGCSGALSARTWHALLLATAAAPALVASLHGATTRLRPQAARPARARRLPKTGRISSTVSTPVGLRRGRGDQKAEWRRLRELARKAAEVIGRGERALAPAHPRAVTDELAGMTPDLAADPRAVSVTKRPVPVTARFAPTRRGLPDAGGAGRLRPGRRDPRRCGRRGLAGGPRQVRGLLRPGSAGADGAGRDLPEEAAPRARGPGSMPL